MALAADWAQKMNALFQIMRVGAKQWRIHARWLAPATGSRGKRVIILVVQPARKA